MKWFVQMKGDFKGFYELSVVREDNYLGIKSCGWGGTDKIILFASNALGGNSLNTRSSKQCEFAKEIAQKLCDSLNA